MGNRVARYRRRHLKKCLNAFLVTCIICTAFNVAADYKLSKDLEQIKWQQEDTLNMIMSHRQSVEPVPAEITEPETVSLGTFKITHYCSCEKCCGKADGVTYTGTQATAGRTIGVDPDVIPLGSTVYIDGQAYIAEDIGSGISGKEIDMFVGSHEEALQKGVYETEVYLYEYK